MTVQQLVDSEIFQVVNIGEDTGRKIEKPFCCDLLSVAMGKAPSGCAWVTVMGQYEYFGGGYFGGRSLCNYGGGRCLR